MNARCISAVVPAAGRSSRFGSMKLLADVAGQPLLARTVGSLIGAGLSEIVVVVAPGHDLEGIQVLRDPRVQLVTNTDPSRGMFSSICQGLLAVQGDPVVILPADMPFVGADTIGTVMEACAGGQAAVVPSYRGQRGHPLVLPRHIARRVADAPATASLKDALLACSGPPVELPVDDAGVLRDVDVPEDLSTPS